MKRMLADWLEYFRRRRMESLGNLTDFSEVSSELTVTSFLGCHRVTMETAVAVETGC